VTQREDKPLGLSGLSAKERKLFLKIGEMAFSQISLKLLHEGGVSSTGKTDKEFEKELMDYIRNSFGSEKFEINIQIDHTARLLSEALKSYREEDYNSAHFILRPISNIG